MMPGGRSSGKTWPNYRRLLASILVVATPFVVYLAFTQGWVGAPVLSAAQTERRLHEYITADRIDCERISFGYWDYRCSYGDAGAEPREFIDVTVDETGVVEQTAPGLSD